jgi:LuxR family transcriptional regulator, maltose regulon positive regulatory protein
VRAADRGRQAIELAEQHGWTEEPAAGAAYGMLGAVLAWQGRTAEAEPWVQRAGRTIRAEAESGTASMVVHHARGVLELARAAAAALAPVLDGSAPTHWSLWLVEAFLLEAIVRDALGDPAAAGRALERALDLAEPDGARFFFLIHPAPRLLERHARHRTAHAALAAEILDLLAGRRPAPPPGGPQPPLEPLSESEIRVLRYLPTNLSTPEIANELYVSPNTVRTHIRHLYAKLGTHHRTEAVARARSLSLLAPSATER